DVSGSQVAARGGANGGAGGRILIYAAPPSVKSVLDVSAQAGSTAGSLYYFPRVDFLTLTASSLAPFSGFSSILFQANHNITLAPGETLDLGAGTGRLTLEAGGDITFGNGSQITDANDWSATLEAGYNFANNTVQSGVGNIYLNGGSGQTGSGSMQLSQASINLTAGNSIVLGSGCQLIDDGGTIGLYAPTLNQDGLIQANSVGNQHGIVELVASDSLTLGANSQITANGDGSSSGSVGGQIMLQTAQTFSDVSGSQVAARGGANGGAGGRILIYAAPPSVKSVLDVSAQAGSTAGSLYYYPRVDYLTLTADSLAPFTGFSHILFQANDDITIAAGATLNLSAGAGSQTSGQLMLEAGNNITFQYDNTFQKGSSISDANNWSIALYAGVSDFTQSTPTVQPDKGSISFFDEFDPSNPQPPTKPSGYIQTAHGDISLVAGQDITLGSAYVITTGGGSISAHALKGKIDTGDYAQGYHFNSGASSLSTAYDLSDGLGGISTAAGGDVTLIAGGDVTSVLPGFGSYYYDGNKISASGDYITAGAGAYGPEPGNVTIVAGGDVAGHYLVANGTGRIYAGVQMDANGNPKEDSSGHYVLGATGNAGIDLGNNGLALSLISGGWNVAAAHNILLQEVSNPNGLFDSSGAYSHYFDYAPDAYVNLSAANLVQLGTTVALPRLTGVNNNLPVIYPSILNITAGAGGVVLGAPSSSSPTSLILFPSPQGSLTIYTTAGGILKSSLNPSGGAPQLFNLVVSDSGRQQYTTSGSFNLSTGNFGINDHGATPVHLNSPTAIDLNIAGDMQLINLIVPEAAQINVGGNMNNCGFQGMNLSLASSFQVQIQEADGTTRSVAVKPGVTSINVGGNINDRSAFTSVSLDFNQTGVQAPDMADLSRAVNNLISTATLLTSLYYNPLTQTLTYQAIPGQSLASFLTLLKNLKVQKVDANGNLLWLDADHTIPDTKTVSILTPQTAQALQAQYNAGNALSGIAANQGLPVNIGFTIGGGGQFNISARNVDLGTSPGILSDGVGLYNNRGVYPLAGLFGNGGVFTRGSDISVNLTGDLTLYSSSIASLNGGNVLVNAGGEINLGSKDFTVNATGARGIYSSSQADVAVYAGGDINIYGSRIAAYNGGNVTVESFNGDVNAGTGGTGFVLLNAYYENPSTHVVSPASFSIPGSGILATTFIIDPAYPAPPVPVGNILVETPNGSVNASAGGIVQLVLDNVDSSGSTVMVLAGYELRDANGHALSATAAAEPTVQAIAETTPGVNDPARSVLVNGDPLQVSASVWPVLLSLLGLPSSDSQVIQLDVTTGKAGLESALRGEGTGLANYNFLGLVSAAKNIDASGSGIIGSAVTLKASGDINGAIFARNNLNISAVQNVNVTALSVGTANISGSSLGDSKIIGIGGIDVSGDASGASLLSNNQISGATGGQSGFAEGTAANSASQSMASDNVAKTTDDATDNQDDEKKKKGKGIALAQKTGRVTVILPPKNRAESKTPDPGT
ncbi:MAG: hypothetical protein WAO02_13685, partial [Verrucomicrobiia bacterium]